jgi:quinoprotein glucose dehydrogenase
MKTNLLSKTNFLFFLVLTFLSCSNSKLEIKDTDWGMYLGGPETNQYSPLTQINKNNVKNLTKIWTFKSHDADEKNRSQIQCNPLIINGVLYGTSPQLKLFSLDAATGKERWRFDPFGGDYKLFGMGVNRGLVYWSDDNERRILYTAGSDIYAVNADNGALINSFGKNGKVDLHTGLGDHAKDLFVVSNTPGIIFQNLLIIGSRVSESLGAAPGYVRAFDVKTGELKWTFHTIPKPGEFGYETWPPDAYTRIGGANAWSGMSLDQDLGIVYVPTGSAAFDFYGGDRHGENLFANSLLALNAETGERIWHYQLVHHDIWDRDLPCPPNLVTIKKDGKKIDAVAQVTKSAHVFIFDRKTGEPIFPIDEKPFPASKLEGEQAWPTQPIPRQPPQFARSRVQEEDLTDLSPEANAYAKQIWANVQEGPAFEPLSEQGSFVFPGLDGGGEWGGGAVDEETGIMYINASEMPWVLQMVKYIPEDDGLLATQGKNIFNRACMICHGKDLKGASLHAIPRIDDIKTRLSKEEVSKIIAQGKGMMPAFGHFKKDEIDAIVAFLFDSKESTTREANDYLADWKYPYVMTGYNRFQDQQGYPAIKPPWGTLNAIDLNKGEILWKKTLGTFPELSEKGMEATGCENYGGPVVTAGGLIFIAATRDEKFRVFDKMNGDLLYETDLPAAGYATPATYAVNGKQYVVIACGGGKLGTKSGDAYVAFALPD